MKLPKLEKHEKETRSREHKIKNFFKKIKEKTSRKKTVLDDEQQRTTRKKTIKETKNKNSLPATEKNKTNNPLKKLLEMYKQTKANIKRKQLEKELLAEKPQEQKRKELQQQKDFTKKELHNEQLKQKKKKREKLHNRQLLRKYLDRAGYDDLDEGRLTKNLFRTVIIICLTLTLIAIIVASVGKPGVKNSLIFLTGIWTGIFAGLFVIGWIVLYVFLDMKMFNRTQALEEVLPDFLQLASANISAGMPVDRALWFAVRPRFGILAKEIEDVAKSTISGEDLKVALVKFTNKYDSVMLKRSINLLLEGMEAGGELADLLNKIALNIQETRILKKEMAANVMTYAIFIGFAAVAAAPILFGLAGQLLVIIQKIMGMMAASGDASATGGLFALDTSGDSITLKDFRIFSIATLFFTSLFSSFIISVIRKGNIKEGVKYVPIFVVATIGLYFIASWILNLLLGGLLTL